MHTYRLSAVTTIRTIDIWSRRPAGARRLARELSGEVAAEEYERVDLRAHSLLADVPIHDVWALDLPGGGAGRSVADLRAVLSVEKLTAANTAVRLLFGLRAWLGRVFAWDREPPQAARESFLHRLSDADRERSLVTPGSAEGPFRVLLVTPRETISEIQNFTVHAFSVFALVDRPGGYRLYWAIHVRSVGRITSWYMRLIDPFRRHIIYPAVLRYIRSAWARDITELPGSAATIDPW